MWITCGLLWCFDQLFGLLFWRHPFTAEDPLVSKWWNAEFLKICSDEETNSSANQQIFIFGWTIALIQLKQYKRETELLVRVLNVVIIVSWSRTMIYWWRNGKWWLMTHFEDLTHAQFGQQPPSVVCDHSIHPLHVRQQQLVWMQEQISHKGQLHHVPYINTPVTNQTVWSSTSHRSLALVRSWRLRPGLCWSAAQRSSWRSPSSFWCSGNVRRMEPEV